MTLIYTFLCIDETAPKTGDKAQSNNKTLYKSP